MCALLMDLRFGVVHKNNIYNVTATYFLLFLKCSLWRFLCHLWSLSQKLASQSGSFVSVFGVFPGSIMGFWEDLTKAEDVSAHFSLYLENISQENSPVFLWCSAKNIPWKLFWGIVLNPTALHLPADWREGSSLWGEVHLSISSPALLLPS